MLNEFMKKYRLYFYFIFRVLAGAMFFLHGAQKLFGWFGGNKFALLSLMGIVGAVEFLSGLFIAIGLFTRLAAFSGLVIMISAYLKVHAPQNIFPIMNGGELALLYLAAFLVLIAYGARKFSIERYFLKKEIF